MPFASNPSSPTTGGFTANPFAGMHQNPRDAHNMYAAAFGTSSSTQSTKPAQGKGLKRMLSFLTF